MSSLAFATGSGSTADDWISSVTISGTATSYHSFTVEGGHNSYTNTDYPTVTNYYYDAVLPTGISNTLVNVKIEANATIGVSFNGQSCSLENEQEFTFLNVNLSSPLLMNVTNGTESRSYRVSAVNNGTAVVYLSIDTSSLHDSSLSDVSTDLITAADALSTAAVRKEVPAGTSVMSVLQSVASDNQIVLTGAENNYVSAMSKNGYTLGAFSYGSLDGWMYWVNEELPMVGASDYLLNGGEVIEWKYITDYTQIDWGI